MSDRWPLLAVAAAAEASAVALVAEDQPVPAAVVATIGATAFGAFLVLYALRQLDQLARTWRRHQLDSPQVEPGPDQPDQ